ncbi:hypothetical protein GQ600_18918 [Phytophthora cactorum]|nr:hypothetical protein GQ600_18918 [Phytophthora cactorum]
MSKVKNDIFNYTWMMTPKRSRGNKASSACSVGHIRATQPLRYDSVPPFVDGTFRSAPKGFHMRDHFPSTRIIGCLFHFKQACRRKMKKYQLSETEAGIAMGFGVLDMLTVIDPEKSAYRVLLGLKTRSNSAVRPRMYHILVLSGINSGTTSRRLGLRRFHQICGISTECNEKS